MKLMPPSLCIYTVPNPVASVVINSTVVAGLPASAVLQRTNMPMLHPSLAC